MVLMGIRLLFNVTVKLASSLLGSTEPSNSRTTNLGCCKGKLFNFQLKITAQLLRIFKSK